MAIARPVAVVTGAGSGIGAAIATHLAVNHDLIVTHLDDDDDLADIDARATSRGAHVARIVGDLTEQRTQEAFARTVSLYSKRLRVLVCNAGAYPRLSWHEVTLEQVRAALEVNLTTHLACVHAATPHMVHRGYGRIVAISSVLTQVGRVDLVPYIAAKGGLEASFHALARELGPHGITVNTVRAGSIQVAAEHRVVADHAAMTERQLARQCIKRRGHPDDIANIVAFLASEAAGFITGQTVNVDGGWQLT